MVDATPRSKSFKIGIPYIYALQFDIDISRDDAPEELQAANEYVEIDDLAARDQQRMLTRRR